MEYNQEVKKDAGKPQLTLVPTQIINDIARIRMYGVEKYKDPDNWKPITEICFLGYTSLIHFNFSSHFK